jgi:hypothetical protein
LGLGGAAGVGAAGPDFLSSTGAATTDGVDAGVGEVEVEPPPPPAPEDEGMGVMLDWIMSMRSMISVPRRFLAGGYEGKR